MCYLHPQHIASTTARYSHTHTHFFHTLCGTGVEPRTLCMFSGTALHSSQCFPFYDRKNRGSANVKPQVVGAFYSATSFLTLIPHVKGKGGEDQYPRALPCTFPPPFSLRMARCQGSCFQKQKNAFPSQTHRPLGMQGGSDSASPFYER